MENSWGQEAPKDVPVRKIKTSELPLSSATRTAIEGLSHKFKKKGGYDAIRHQVWNQLAGSVSCIVSCLTVLANKSPGLPE